jgi:hypothetical protein
MKGEIILDNPVLIDGKPVKSFMYDANEITTDLFMDAETQMLKRRTRAGAVAIDAKLDYSFQLCLGCAAIIAVNSSVAFEDLARLKGADLQRVKDVGRDFILGQSGDGSEAGISEDLPETTPGNSAPPPQSSEDSD